MFYIKGYLPLDPMPLEIPTAPMLNTAQTSFESCGLPFWFLITPWDGAVLVPNHLFFSNICNYITSIWFDCWLMFLMFQCSGLMKGNLVWGIWNLYGNLLKKKKLFIAACSMNADKMETAITSETISQQTVCGEIEKPNDD